MNKATVSAWLKQHEGVVPWMYLDTAGVVTVGVGHALETEEDAASLPFRLKDTGEPAHESVIRADWRAVKAAQPGLLAEKYSRLTNTILSKEHIDWLLDYDIEKHWVSLLARRPELSTLPEQAQNVLAEMAFNLGVGGLLQYRRMIACMMIGDWEQAAEESSRLGVSPKRNNQTAQLIRALSVGQSEGANS